MGIFRDGTDPEVHQTKPLVCIPKNKAKKSVYPWILSKGSDLLRKNSLHSKLTKFNEEELMYIYREHVKAVRGDLGSRRPQVGCIIHIY